MLAHWDFVSHFPCLFILLNPDLSSCTTRLKRLDLESELQVVVIGVLVNWGLTVQIQNSTAFLLANNISSLQTGSWAG